MIWLGVLAYAVVGFMYGRANYLRDPPKYEDHKALHASDCALVGVGWPLVVAFELFWFVGAALMRLPVGFADELIRRVFRIKEEENKS